MKTTLLIMVFIISLILLVSFFSIDACLDAGGQWAHYGLTCEGVGVDFIPQYKRPAPLFWGLVMAISALVTWSVNKCTGAVGS